MADDHTGEETANYLRLTILLDEGTKMVRSIFRTRFHQLTSMEWKDDPKCGNLFLSKMCDKSLKKIQKKMIKSGEVDTWDLTTLNIAWANLKSVKMTKNSTPSPHTVEADDRKKFKQENMSINQLTDVRNKYAHLANKRLSLDQFSDLWSMATKALQQLGGNVDDFERLRTSATIGGINFEVDKNPQRINEYNAVKAKKLRQDGNEAYRTKNFHEAIYFYSEALNLAKISIEERTILLSNRSLTYLQLIDEDSVHCQEVIDSQCTAALSDASEAIDLRPGWWKGYFRAGKVYQRQKQWNAALLAFGQALTLNPGGAEIIAARDACRFDGHKERREEHLDPLTRPFNLDEFAHHPENPRNRQKIHKVPTPSIAEQLKINEILLKSKNPWNVGHANAFMGHRYRHGIDGFAVNFQMAAVYFAKSAAVGYAEGIYNLGLLYQEGRGVKRDFGRAVELFEQAAEMPTIGRFGRANLGVAEAQFAIGQCYRFGHGKPIDLEKAAKWFHKSSDNGCSNASNNLGLLYEKGQGVEKCRERAKQFWKLAASRGNALAMSSLSFVYLEDGDLDQAEAWHARSIEAGNLGSTMNKKKFDQLVKIRRTELGSGNHKNKKLQKETVLKDMRMPLDDQNKELQMVDTTAFDFVRFLSQFDDEDEHSDTVSDEEEARLCEEESIKNSWLKLTDPMRVEVVLAHREKMKEAADEAKLMSSAIGNSRASKPRRNGIQPTHNQKAPSQLSSLKEISLGQMDTRQDHVYVDRVIKLTVMEDSIFDLYQSIHTVVCDGNGDYILCYFYNLQEKDDKWKNGLRFGSILSIMNPYFRLTVDGKFGLRVDDPKSVVFHEDGQNEPKCRFCGRPNPANNCARCKRAGYCDKKCQEEDWKVLKHKMICGKNFGPFV